MGGGREGESIARESGCEKGPTVCRSHLGTKKKGEEEGEEEDSAGPGGATGQQQGDNGPAQLALMN